MQRFLLPLACILLFACSSDREVVTGVNETEANQILVFLAAKGIQGQKSGTTAEAAGGQQVTVYTITVPEGQALDAMAQLTSSGLPRPPETNLLSLFAAQGMMQTPQEQEIRYQAGLAEQLAGMVRRFDGVLDSAVVLSMPPAASPGAAPSTQKTTASVYIKHAGVLDDPNSQLGSKVRRLLSGAVPNLSIDDVTVVSERSMISDLSVTPTVEAGTRPSDWGSVVGVVVERSSISKLRWIVGTLTLLMFAFLASTLWLLWKVTRILQQQGWRSLLQLAPLTLEAAEEEPQDNE